MADKKTVNLAAMQALMDQHSATILPGPLASHAAAGPSTIHEPSSRRRHNARPKPAGGDEASEADPTSKDATPDVVQLDPTKAPRRKSSRSSKPATASSLGAESTEPVSQWAIPAMEKRLIELLGAPEPLVPAQCMIPDEVYQLMREWQLEHTDERKRYTLAMMLEAALEQIPDDIDDLSAMLTELPSRFTLPNVNRVRSVRVRPETARKLARLPLELRAAGYLRHAGRIHTVAVIRLLADLGVTVGR